MPTLRSWQDESRPRGLHAGCFGCGWSCRCCGLAGVGIGTARARVMGSYIRTEMSAHKHGIYSMTTVLHCTRTGCGCSEPTCQERQWCRKMFERGLSHRGLPLKRKFRPKCCAKTRAGGQCIMRVVPGKRRCRFHGGLSTGPKTVEGRARIAEAQRRRWRAFRAVVKKF